jgi:hypothetical protein
MLLFGKVACMNAQVIYEGFTHQHNTLDVARQEYDLAKAHFNDVCQYRNSLNQEHNRRFTDAIERKRLARDRFVKLLCE